MTSPPAEKTKTKRLPDSISCFIKKTYELLEDQKFPDFVDWNDEGTAIVIKKPTEFGQKVLPTYFKHSNLTSFVRQLNMYDFHKRRTQKYDHVYYHDLFQRDKKTLLSEIRRKNQENTLANIQKAIETLETAQGGQKLEGVPSSYEHQLLKKLNKDALVRIATLENKVKELTVQNQTLHNQKALQSQKENVLVSFLATFMKKKGITLDQLPKVLHNQFNMRPMEFEILEKLSFAKEMEGLKQENDQVYEKPLLPVNVGDFLNFSEDLSNSTEISPSSPLSKGYTADCDGLMQGQNCKYDTKCESEYSVLPNRVESWKASNDVSEKFSQNFFGKRCFESEKDDPWNVQKMIKKDPYSLPPDGNPFMITIGAKEELEDMKVRKFDSFFDMYGNAESHNNSIDLMNFS